MKHPLYNYAFVLRFQLQRDWKKIFLYLFLMTGFLVSLIPVFRGILDSSSSIEAIVETMKNPAMIAMLGPVYETGAFTTASMYGSYMLVFTAIMTGIWNIYYVSLNTKKEEEKGIAELIFASPIGKHSPLTATLTIAGITNLSLALCILLGFGFMEMPLRGNLVFALATCGFGFFMACATALFSQIATTYRTVQFLSYITLMGMYFLRAIGDVMLEELSLAVPLGLILRTENYVNDNLWPIGILLVEVLILLGLTYALAHQRELYGGILQEPKGRKTLSPLVIGVGTFLLKIYKTPLLIWFFVVFSFSTMYASIFGELETYIDSSELMQQMILVNPEFSVTEQFVSLLMVVMALISTIPLLGIVHRILHEEDETYSALVLATPLSRMRYLGSFILQAILFSILLQITTAISFWFIGNMVVDFLPSLQTFITAAFAYLPAMWVMVGISVLLVGSFPTKEWLNYFYLGWAAFAIYFGRMLDFPKWTAKLTPFGWVSQYPVEELEKLPLIILFILSVVLIGIGMMGYRKRDLLK